MLEAHAYPVELKVNMVSNSKVIYKITYPNGKIDIGKNLTNSINYWGRAKSAVIAEDFSFEERMNVTIHREIIFYSDSATEINKKEAELIGRYNPNNPDIGYNRWPNYKE